jgi:hypothetical protein
VIQRPNLMSHAGIGEQRCRKRCFVADLIDWRSGICEKAPEGIGAGRVREIVVTDSMVSVHRRGAAIEERIELFARSWP